MALYPWKYLLISLFLFLFFLGVAIDSSRAFIDQAPFLKYAALTVFFVASVAAVRKRSSIDVISLGALAFFILFTVLFTVFSELQLRDLSVLLGYVVCFGLYFVTLKVTSVYWACIKQVLLIAAVLFSIWCIPSIFDDDAYTFIKNQFSGPLFNPNALAGMAGFFLVYVVSRYFNEQSRILRALFVFLSVVMLVFIFLSFSRGVLLGVFVVGAILLFRLKRYYLLTLVFSMASVFLLFYGYGDGLGFGGFGKRDLFEETGRGDILNSYIARFYDTYFVFGTGVSASGGRIKSELSYLDILLFSGVGAIGFFVFCFRLVYLSIQLNLKSGDNYWAIPLFYFVIISSVTEGYVANIASVPSLFFYILSGLISREFMLMKINRSGALELS